MPVISTMAGTVADVMLLKKFLGCTAIAALVLMALSPNLAWVWREAGPQPWLFGVIPAIGVVVLLFALLARLDYALVVLIPFAVVAPWELFYFLTYAQPSSEHVIGIIADTDTREAQAFLAGVAVPLGLASAATVLIGVYGYLAARRWKIRWRDRTRHWVIAAGLLGLGSLAGFYAWTDEVFSESARTLDGDVGRLTLGDDDSSLSHQLKRSYPAGLYWRFSGYVQQRVRVAEALDKKQAFRFGARKRFAQPGREIYVLVIGETGRPDRWQLNGYPRATTPRLMARDGLVSFSDFVSPWSWTRMSVPIILTRKPPLERDDFFSERSVVSAFSEAGFRTSWLSVQGVAGLHENPVLVYAKEADDVRFINLSDYKQRGALDGDLLEPFASLLRGPYGKQFIVVHTMGSHFNYAHRYPDDYDVFQPSLTSLKVANLHDRAQKEHLNNSYDNSVVYTDWIIDSLIALLDAEGAMSYLFYVADHGENLFDGDCNKSGHGHNTERDFRVPALLWTSERFRQANPQRPILRSRDGMRPCTRPRFSTPCLIWPISTIRRRPRG